MLLCRDAVHVCSGKGQRMPEDASRLPQKDDMFNVGEVLSAEEEVVQVVVSPPVSPPVSPLQSGTGLT